MYLGDLYLGDLDLEDLDLGILAFGSVSKNTHGIMAALVRASNLPR